MPRIVHPPAFIGTRLPKILEDGGFETPAEQTNRVNREGTISGYRVSGGPSKGLFARKSLRIRHCYNK